MSLKQQLIDLKSKFYARELSENGNDTAALAKKFKEMLQGRDIEEQIKILKKDLSSP